MAARADVEITPLGIRSVRHALRLSQKQMGESIAEYIQGPGFTPIPGSRINEWEMRARAIPDYVFVACAGVLINRWAKLRKEKRDEELERLDLKFARLLSPALASAISLEDEYRGRRDKHGVVMHAQAMEVRKEVQTHFESLLRINLSQILGGPEGGRCP